MFFNSLYSLRQSKNILKTSYAWYKKKGNTLSPDQLHHLEQQLEQLDQAILRKDRPQADQLARELNVFGKERFKKSFFEYALELVLAVIFALVVATLVRQMWFEPYEIPTGSMRPTFKEQDHLTVSKTAFGINYPLKTDHLYFDPNLVQRTGIVIWSGDNIPLPDPDTTFLGVLPYKKRYIKRLMGKPGDTVYFYGGKLYVIDAKDNLIEDYLTAPWMEKIESIPFIDFEGMPYQASERDFIFRQMYLPLARLSFNPRFGTLKGDIYNGEKWIKEETNALKQPHREIKSFSDFWGIGNYAMARLLTKEQAQHLGYTDLNDSQAVLYLELKHTPNVTYPAPQITQTPYGGRISLGAYTTLIPLHQSHLDQIMKNMYTARFDIKDGRAKKYDLHSTPYSAKDPIFKGVEDGRYEFYYGKAYKLGFGALENVLDASSPLYSSDPINVQKLFNQGIDFKYTSTASLDEPFFPHRYAYFREGDLYLLGAPILKQTDPVLVDFVKKEEEKEQNSSADRPYIAFKDHGPPIKAGKPNLELFKQFGLKIPEKHYLVLGDNHAMSSDSRVFGFVPEQNLQGAPSLLLWPLGERTGFLPQKPYPLLVFPRLVIWGIVLTCLLLWYLMHRYHMSQPIYKKVW